MRKREDAEVFFPSVTRQESELNVCLCLGRAPFPPLWFLILVAAETFYPECDRTLPYEIPVKN